MKKRLQVFISSTFTDLLEERQAAVGAILKAGHIPAGMELFTAGDKSQWKTIEHWIDESDVYMIIVGGRYGSIEPASGLSYTELEYDYALKQSKPLFAVVIDPGLVDQKVKLHGTAVIETQNPKELAKFRDKVLSNISSFFKSEADIKLAVYEALADFASTRDLKGWIRGDAVVDTTPLFDEIRKLSEENKSLREQVASTASKVQHQRDQKGALLDELVDLLQAMQLKVPGKLIDKPEDVEVNPLRIFNGFKERYLVGITNQSGMSDWDRYLFFTVAPILQVHGLIENEKVAGAKYRRCVATAAGRELLAHLDRREFRSKAESKMEVKPENPDDSDTQKGDSKPKPPRKAKKAA
jgi:hypothetical protein